MRGRAILLVMPSLAMSVVGIAMFGPGAARPFVSAEIWGGPGGASNGVSLRVLALERLRGIDSARDIGEVLVRLSAGDALAGEGRCTTDASGACDILIAGAGRPSAERLRAEVYALPSGRELASGELADAVSWGGDGGHAAELVAPRADSRALSVTARRGVFVAPFRDELAIGAMLPLPFRLTTRAVGADLAIADGLPEPALYTDADGLVLEHRTQHDVLLGVTPRTHAVDLEIEAAHEGTVTRWSGTLPIIPGAMWLDPITGPGGSRRVVSAVPRDIAYASIASDRRRLWGGAVALMPDGHGFHAGSLTLPPSAREEDAPLWLTLSSDPRGTGSGTVGWPLWPERTPESLRERPFRDRRLLDGMPLAEQRDQQRRARARNPAWNALAAAACVEAAMLAQIAGRPGGRSAWIRLTVALATVVLAFSAVGLIVMWKTSS